VGSPVRAAKGFGTKGAAGGIPGSCNIGAAPGPIPGTEVSPTKKNVS
jgi:hypothetical protein